MEHGTIILASIQAPAVVWTLSQHQTHQAKAAALRMKASSWPRTPSAGHAKLVGYEHDIRTLGIQKGLL